MSTSDYFPEAPLVGRDAISWFQTRRRFGPYLLDLGLGALGQSFGNQRELSAFVATPGPRGVPRDFFLAVDGDVADDNDWERLVRAYQQFDEQSQRMEHEPGFAWQRSTFNLVLRQDPPGAVPAEQVHDEWFRSR